MTEGGLTTQGANSSTVFIGLFLPQFSAFKSKTVNFQWFIFQPLRHSLKHYFKDLIYIPFVENRLSIDMIEGYMEKFYGGSDSLFADNTTYIQKKIDYRFTQVLQSAIHNLREKFDDVHLKSIDLLVSLQHYFATNTTLTDELKKLRVFRRPVRFFFNFNIFMFCWCINSIACCLQVTYSSFCLSQYKHVVLPV